MSFTVVPLHNLNLPVGSRIPFGKKFVLQDVPEWLKKDTGFLNDIARYDMVGTLEAKHALVSEYGRLRLANQTLNGRAKNAIAGQQAFAAPCYNAIRAG